VTTANIGRLHAQLEGAAVRNLRLTDAVNVRAAEVAQLRARVAELEAELARRDGEQAVTT